MPTMPKDMFPLASAYTAQATGGVSRTEIEGGPARYALAYDRGVQRFNVSMFLTPLRYSVWNTFFHHTIKKGAVTFDMPLDSGYGEQQHAVNIVPGSYTVTRSGGTHSIVSFQVETENKAYEFTEADADGLLELYEEYGDESDALLRRLAGFALVDTLLLDF